MRQYLQGCNLFFCYLLTFLISMFMTSVSAMNVSFGQKAILVKSENNITLPQPCDPLNIPPSTGSVHSLIITQIVDDFPPELYANGEILELFHDVKKKEAHLFFQADADASFISDECLVIKFKQQPTMASIIAIEGTFRFGLDCTIMCTPVNGRFEIRYPKKWVLDYSACTLNSLPLCYPFPVDCEDHQPEEYAVAVPGAAVDQERFLLVETSRAPFHADMNLKGEDKEKCSGNVYLSIVQVYTPALMLKGDGKRKLRKKRERSDCGSSGLGGDVKRIRQEDVESLSRDGLDSDGGDEGKSERADDEDDDEEDDDDEEEEDDNGDVSLSDIDGDVNDPGHPFAPCLTQDGKLKRPLNAFMCFCKKRRGEIRSGGAEAHQSGLSKVLGAEWGAMSGRDKKPFEKEAKMFQLVLKHQYPNYKHVVRKKTPKALIFHQLKIEHGGEFLLFDKEKFKKGLLGIKRAVNLLGEASGFDMGV